MSILRAFTILTTLTTYVSAQTDHIATANSTQLRNFLSYCAKHNKQYASTTDLNNRLGLYLATADFIANYPPSSFEMSHNMFSDRTDQEK